MNIKNLRVAILFLAALGLFSCQNKTRKTVLNQDEIVYPVEIDFGNNFKNYQQVNLSQIADSVEYVKLENSPESLVKQAWSVHVCDSFIFVAQYNSLLQFNRKGKFIRQIGKKGRGPQEYVNVYGLCVNRNDQRLYVNAGKSKKIQVYDFEGEYKTGYKYFTNREFDMLDSVKVVSSIENFHGQEPLKFLVTGPDKDTLASLTNTVKFPFQKGSFMISTSFERRFYRWNDVLHFLPQYGDTVFQMKTLNSIKPKYVINKGKYKLPVNSRIERLKDFKKFELKAGKYIQTVVHEIKNYVLISYTKANYDEERRLALYDKRSGELFSIGNPDLKAYGFINNLDGCGNYIHQAIQDNRYMVSYDPAISVYEEFQERITKIKNGDIKDNANPRYNDFMKSVKMDDNLIVQIVHLKKR